MLENYQYYKDIGISLVKAKTLEGIVQYIDIASIVGYCNCDTHKGHVTVRLLKKHECIEKSCPFLHKFDDFPYWINLRNVARQKEIQKKQRQHSAFKKKKAEVHIDDIKNTAQLLANRLFFPIVITSVIQKERNLYVINYVSDDGYNDWSEYFSLAVMLRSHYNGGTYRLNHIKTADGYYATIYDYKQKHTGG